MKKVVVLTGAGISAESGLKTFRDSDGLWENYNVYDVATPEAWHKNPALVQEFYNQRRKQCVSAQPNEGHLALKKLEQKFNVNIIHKTLMICTKKQALPIFYIFMEKSPKPEALEMPH